MTDGDYKMLHIYAKGAVDWHDVRVVLSNFLLMIFLIFKDIFAQKL